MTPGPRVHDLAVACPTHSDGTTFTSRQLLLISICLSAVLLVVPALAAVTSVTYTSVVGQTIPDGPSGGGSGTPLLNTIDVPPTSLVVGVEVYLDISMVDWTSDLIVRLTSPEGTRLGLAWIGEVTEGAWELDCRDYSNGAVGTLNQWRLKLVYDDSVPVEAVALSDIKVLFD